MDTIWCISWSVFLLLSQISASSDSITASEYLTDGDTLVSDGGKFELGFFSPGSSPNRYLGIWYKNIPIRTVVWVGNRQYPITDLSGKLTINNSGSLILASRNNTIVWSTNASRVAQDPALQLLDSGNLVLRDNKDAGADIYLWQSFDYPSDTLLPGMKLGWNLRTGLNRRLYAWKNPNDPSPGELSEAIELDENPQIIIWRGNRKYFRGGPWNGLRFSGGPELRANLVFDFKFISTPEEVYYTYQLNDKSVISRFVLNESASVRERYVWVAADRSWKLYSSVPRDYCDTYGLCGANGVCVITDSPVCQCLKGFKPKFAENWNATDWSQGCIRNKPLDCNNKHDFVKFSDLKLPDTAGSWVNRSLSLRECRDICLRNCSCMVYTNSDISGRGSGCVLWFGNLVDIREFSDGGQDLYIRMPTSGKGKRHLVISALIVVPITLGCGLLLASCYFYRRKLKGKGAKEDEIHINEPQNEDLDLPLLNIAAIEHATDSFSENKKLGEGGFGPVYLGILADGKKVAVKRLSKTSRQGLEQFKNEVKLIAMLQHRNLVKLVGCCIGGNEKILVYEYMHNRSLDSFLFDQTKGRLLDWPKRLSIICGIARGLLYLHQDSRLRIIHRDLKSSNVLLDNELNPKISDFGMARTFGGDQDGDNTRRIVGTYGYMAPEYAFYGLFSVKSDVFSFGILILEIVSGKKSRGFEHSEDHHNLIGYAWKLWTEGRSSELIDPLLEVPCIQPEMLRCIHVGLLCVQQSPEDRPTMSTVVLMLNGESTLPQPKRPGFLIDMIPSGSGPSSRRNDLFSSNDITITSMEAR